MSGFQGGSSFTGSGGLSIDVTGAGNLNGKAAIDGSFSSEERNAEAESENRPYVDDEMATGNKNDFGRGLMEKNDVGLESPESGNVNSQSAVYQYGMDNSNKQGDIVQQTFRRQNNSIHQLPKKHLICGYYYKTIYPNIQQQSLNVERDVLEPYWQNVNDRSMVGQYGIHRVYSGPFNHLL